MCLLCGGGPLLCPAVVWGVFFQTFPLPFPLLKFFFTLLVSFIWNSQKCPISQNIWCLIKTQLKNSIQTIFHGGSPWATLILNSTFVVGVHYCVQLLPEAFFLKHSLYLFLCKSFFCFLCFFQLKFSEMPNFPKYMMSYWNPIKKQHPNNFSRG